MDNLFKKDQLSEVYERYVAFDRYKKGSSQKKDDFMIFKHFRRGIHFLHLTDLHTQFSLAKIIKSKPPSVIIQSVIIMWVANGFGTPK